MAYIPAVNVAEAVVFGTLASQQIAMVLNFLYPTAITTTQLEDLAEGIVVEWGNNLATQISTQLQMLSGKVTDLTTASSPVREFFPASPVPGTVGSASVASNAALVISHHTAQRGRSFRGRTYIAGVPLNGTVDAGHITATYQTNILAAWQNYIADVESLGGNFVIVSRENGGVPRTTAVATPVTAESVNVDLDSQRRRLPGRGA